MADVVFIAIALGFFALCVAYVRAADRIVRSAAAPEATTAPSDVSSEVTA